MFYFMKYNSKLALFNSSKGTMLILRILYEQAPLDKSTLQSEFEKYGVGGTAYNTSMEILEKLELIQSRPEQISRRGRASLLQSLTEKGKKIAENIVGIDDLLF